MKPRVLVVDGNALLRELLYVALKDRYAVTALRDADRLPEAFESQDPDVVLLDAGLAAKCRADMRRSVPVVLMTSMRASEEERALGLAVSAVIAKPFTARELLDTLDRVVEP